MKVFKVNKFKLFTFKTFICIFYYKSGSSDLFKYINTIVKKALDEDLKPHGDITTNLISFKDKKIKAKIIARQNGVISGLDLCKSAFKLIGKETIFTSKVKDGSKIRKNKVIAEIKAKTKTILIMFSTENIKKIFAVIVILFSAFIVMEWKNYENRVIAKAKAVIVDKDVAIIEPEPDVVAKINLLEKIIYAVLQVQIIVISD